MVDGREQLYLRIFGPFEAEVRDADGHSTQLEAASFRPLMKVLIGVIVEDGGTDRGIDFGRVLRVMWEETVDGPGETFHRRVPGNASPGSVESVKTGDEIARQRLNRTLNDLRKAVDDHAASPRWVRRDGDTLRLVNTTADVTEFRDLWETGRYDEALALVERGTFLSGTRMRQRNASAQRWLEETRLSWANRIDSCLASRERDLLASHDRESALEWALARKRIALAHGGSELIARVARHLEEYDDAYRPQKGYGVDRRDGRGGAASTIAAQLDAWSLAGNGGDEAVAVVLGDPAAADALPDALACLADRGVAARYPKGGSGRFGHARTVRKALSEATHCIYLLADGEQPRTGWGAFAGAAAAEEGIPFSVIDATRPQEAGS